MDPKVLEYLTDLLNRAGYTVYPTFRVKTLKSSVVISNSILQYCEDKFGAKRHADQRMVEQIAQDLMRAPYALTRTAEDSVADDTKRWSVELTVVEKQ